ncbi:unnamed protein product [Rotaria socialis]|uniref:Uncharacterized protein n=3 Tax=Rotaria socialis TaxID=392032 RepID=A0A818JZF0_9BILA|nr:unnamed protein product [Rotaria socialis]CAF3715889.1 unnamed protein product [Rotaria socialis]
MTTRSSSATRKYMCDLCSPKQTVSITKCDGCLRHMCNKHFNDHRHKLSTDLDSVFNFHNDLQQSLQRRIDDPSTSPDYINAIPFLKQIDEWERSTIERVSQRANEARANIEHFFSRRQENNKLKQLVETIGNEAQEHKESESFVDTDINNWKKQLKNVQTAFNRPSEIKTDSVFIQIKDIDWNTIIRASFSGEQREHTSTDYFSTKCSLVMRRVSSVNFQSKRNI